LIFVALGTHGQSFARALELVSALDGTDEMLIQHGVTPPGAAGPRTRWIEHTPWETFSAAIRSADVIICQAGVGTVVTAIRCGHRPVLLPRLARYGEHVDDHQLQLAERLSERGLAYVAGPGADLAALVAVARGAHGSAGRLGGGGRAQLSGAVAACIPSGRGAERGLRFSGHPDWDRGRPAEHLRAVQDSGPHPDRQRREDEVRGRGKALQDRGHEKRLQADAPHLELAWRRPAQGAAGGEQP
jgi:UDP-N-acetylglucosamine transferase subunit ALG13